MMFDHNKQTIELQIKLLQIQTIVFVTSHKKGKNAKSIFDHVGEWALCNS